MDEDICYTLPSSRWKMFPKEEMSEGKVDKDGAHAGALSGSR